MTLNDKLKLLDQMNAYNTTPSTGFGSAEPGSVSAYGGNLPDNRDTGTKIMENVATGGYGVLNSLLLGLPDFLIRNIGGSENFKKLQALKNRNKEAGVVGDVAGTIGSFFIPGGAVVKGIGMGAKALGAAESAAKLAKAAEFLKGTQVAGGLGSKIATGALRGAGQAAEQAIPRALTNLDFTEGGKNLGESAKEGFGSAISSIGLGAGLGGAISPLISKLTKKGNDVIGEYGKSLNKHAIDEAREALDKKLVGDVGVETRALRNAANFLMPTAAAKAKRGGDYVNDFAEWLRDNKIYGKRGFEAALERNDHDWKMIDKAFTENAKPGWNVNLAQDIANDTGLHALGGQEGASKAADIAKIIADTDNLSTVRNTLSQAAKDGMRSTNMADQAGARIAFAAKKKVDDFVADQAMASGLGADFVANAKNAYKNLQPFLIQESRDAFKIPRLSGGSGTFEKAATGALLGGGAGSFARDDEGNLDVGKILGGVGLGALGGQSLSKLLPRLLEKSTSGAARLASGVLANEKLTGAVEKGLSELPKNLPKTASIVAQKQALTKPATADQDPVETIQAKESVQSPDQQIKNKAQFSERFKSIMNQQLQNIYNTYYSDMDQQDFLKQVSDKTGGFQDMPAMAEILYLGNPKGREDFLRKYDAYLSIKNMDIDKALKGKGGILGLFGDEQAGKDQELLKEKLLNLQTEGDLSKRTKTQKDLLNEQIKAAQQSPELMAAFIKNYGLDFNDLKQMGLL